MSNASSASPVPAADRPLVSLIIPVYDDADRLRLCLQAIARQTWPRTQLEVLVVDNNSHEDIRAAVRDFDFVRLLHEPAPGSYAARNTGLAAAQGSVLAFTDADCLPDEHWLERGVAALLSTSKRYASTLVGVGGPVRLFAQHEGTPTWVETYELATGFDQRRYIEEQHYTVTANCLATREAFQHTGQFDSALRSAGDKEWGQRAYAAGVTLVYAPDAVVRHPARHDLGELLSKRRRQTGGQWRALQSRRPRWAATAQVLVNVTRPPLTRVAKAWINAQDRSPLGRLRSAARVLAVASALSVACSVEVVRLHLGKAEER